jgi:transketolase
MATIPPPSSARSKRYGEDPRPSLIAVRTVIGYGSPNRAGTQKAHGQALGEEEVRLTKQFYGWDPTRRSTSRPRRPSFFRQAVPRGDELHAEWRRAGAPPRTSRPRRAELRRRIDGRLPDGWDADLPTGGWCGGGRHAQRLAGHAAGAWRGTPELIGGAADLSESNLTDIKGDQLFNPDVPGRNILLRRASTQWVAHRTALPTTAG